MTKGYAAADTAAAYARAQEMGERVADPVPLALLLMGLWAARINADGPLAAQPLADQVLVAAERSGLAPLQVWAHFAQAATHLHSGRFASAAESADRALALYDADSALIVPVDPSIATLAYAAIAAWYLGRPDTARRLALDGVDRARGAGRPADRAWAEVFASVGVHRCDVSRRSLSATRNRRSPRASRSQTLTLSQSPRSTAGGRWQSRGRLMKVPRSCGRGWHDTASWERDSVSRQYTGLLADALAASGQIDAALAVLVEGEGACPVKTASAPARCAAAPSCSHGRSRARRRKANRPLAAEEVEQVYRESLDVARRQGAKGLELRTATSYAGWLGRHGRAAEGRALLAPIYATFTEGFDTRDLIEAKALLKELR